MCVGLSAHPYESVHKRVIQSEHVRVLAHMSLSQCGNVCDSLRIICESVRICVRPCMRLCVKQCVGQCACVLSSVSTCASMSELPSASSINSVLL